MVPAVLSEAQISFIPENPLPWMYFGSGSCVNAEEQLVDPRPTLRKHKDSSALIVFE